MKKNNNYQYPDLELVKYSAEDVLNNSGGSSGSGGNHGIPLPDDEWPDEENNT